MPKLLEARDSPLITAVRRDFISQADQKLLVYSLLKLDASLCIPVRSNGKLLGIFALGDKESGLPYGKEDIKSLKVLANHTGVALENFDLARRWSEEFSQK